MLPFPVNSSLSCAAGVFVPNSFEDFGIAINTVYAKLVEEGVIKASVCLSACCSTDVLCARAQVRDEGAVPTIPVDYDWARKLGLIRKPSAFVSSIVDERGDELVYAGMKISEVFKSNLGVGGVVGLIWFRKRLPDYFCRSVLGACLISMPERAIDAKQLH